MKLSLLAIAAVAAAASANPVRIVPPFGTEDAPVLPPKEVLAAVADEPASELHIGMASFQPDSPRVLKPCHGHGASKPDAKSVSISSPSSYLPGPIGALLSRIGFASPKERHEANRAALASAVRWREAKKGSHEHEHMEGMEHWREHVSALMQEAESEIVPLLEGGTVRILPIYTDETNIAPPSDHAEDADSEDRENRWAALEGKNGVKKYFHHHHKEHAQTDDKERQHRHHIAHAKGRHGRHGKHGHRHGHSFSGRLHRALRHLKPTEAITLAFVMGAGIGSILHFVFMLFLLSVRRWRGAHCSEARAERRAARKEARKARKAERVERIKHKLLAKLGRGEIRLEGSDVLPEYSDAQVEVVEEKA